MFPQRVFHYYLPPTPPDLDLDSSEADSSFKLPGYFAEEVRRNREKKDPRYFYLQFLPLYNSPTFWFPVVPFDRATFRYDFYDRIVSRIFDRSEQLCSCYCFVASPRISGCIVCKTSLYLGSWDFFFPPSAPRVSPNCFTTSEPFVGSEKYRNPFARKLPIILPLSSSGHRPDTELVRTKETAL